MSSCLALELRDLTIELRDGRPVVQDVDLEVPAGEIVGIVGESGAGKTTTALALLGYANPGARLINGDLTISGSELSTQESREQARGGLITYVPQRPGSALNPSRRIGHAIRDMLTAHGSTAVRGEEIGQHLRAVGLDGSEEFQRRYPHQLSGGQQQRVCIAIALAVNPSVVVLDEPTTGLDVVSQAQILAELRRLSAEAGTAMVYVTHDLAVVAEIANRIVVMYGGRVVEQGPAHDVLEHPRHPYTRGLMAASPDHTRPSMVKPMPGIAAGVTDRLPGCAFAPRCPQVQARCSAELPALLNVLPEHDVRCFEWSSTPGLVREEGARRTRNGSGEHPVLAVEHLTAEHRTQRGQVTAVNDVSFSLESGACLAVVGESGSGKTTLAWTIAGLHNISSGSVLLHGKPLASAARHRTIEQRTQLQIVFQHPAEALNPTRTVRDEIARPMKVLRHLGSAETNSEVDKLLYAVRLPQHLADRYPKELSGGEQQRVAMARALAADPEVIICDEVTSALDVSVQAAVLDLLQELRATLGVSMIFITHDLGVVSSIADDVVVLQNGHLCERGSVATVLEAPAHPYTRRLLAAAPSLGTTVGANGRGVDDPTA